MQTKVKKWGNSIGIRIPKIYVDEVQLHDGILVDMKIEKDKLIIKPHKDSEYNLQELLSKVTDKNLHTEIITGKNVGKEIW